MSLTEILLSDDSFSCSWAAGSKNTRDSVTWGKEYSGGLEAVSLDTCVQLSRGHGPHGRQSEIHFVLQRNIRVTRMTVVSDARMVELYGSCGEYVNTYTGDFVDEFEEMSVYVAEVVLPQPLSECTVKFAGLKTSDEMWLYGIHLTVEETVETTAPKRLIDYHNVSHMIEQSGRKLSDNAVKCQNFLQSFSAGDMLASGDISGLLEGRAPLNGETLRNFASLLGGRTSFPAVANGVLASSRAVPRETPAGNPETLGVVNGLGNGDAGASSHPGLTNGSLASGHCMDSSGDQGMLDGALCNLKDYIERRFKQSEKLLLARVDDKFKELEARQNEKLDLILQQIKLLNTTHNGSLT